MNFNWGFSLSKSGGSTEPVVVDPDRYTFFASRARMPTGYAVDTTSIGATYFGSRLKFGSASFPCGSLMFHYSGFAMTEGGLSPQETVLAGNDVVIDGVTLIYNGTSYAADFSGSATATITSGSKGAWCTFPTAPMLASEADFEVVTRWHVASVGQKFLGNTRIQKHRNEKYWAASDATALDALITADAATSASVDAFYAVAPGNQTNSQLLVWGPDMMLAKGGYDNRPVVLATTDSIGYGRQEVSASADDRGNIGWLGKWLDTNNSIGRIPHMIIGAPGGKCFQELTTSATLRWDLLDDIKAFNGGKYPFTIVVNQMGTNDNNAVVSTWKSRISGLISRIKTRCGPNMKVLQCTIAPQNGTTGSYLTADAITVSSPSWTTNRNSINSDIRNNIGIGHDGFIDLDTAWTDPANPDKFISATGLGQVGTVLSVTPGDGVSINPTGVVDYPAKIGDQLLIEYQPGTYAGRQVIAVSGSGPTWNVTFANVYTTAFQANAKAYWAISQDGIHPNPGYIDHWIVPRLNQADKHKLQYGVLPALPLAAGAKVMGLGHSFIGLGTLQGYSAAQTATNGHQGFYENGRTVLSWVKAADGRFNLDMFAELNHPFFAPSSFAAFSGAMAGKSGDCLNSVAGLEAQFPGTLARTDYALSQKPDIIYLDIGYNDIVRNRRVADILFDLDAQVSRIVKAGVFVVLQTLSWTSTLNDDPVNDDPSWPATLDAINAWIVQQNNRAGVFVCNTLALDGPTSGITSDSFVDGLHPKPDLMAKRSDILLPILRTIVASGETRSLDPLNAYNIFPAKGTPGTTGTATNVTGSVATGMRLVRGTGTSTYVASKEVVATGNEKQVITITPVNDAAAVHTVTYGTTAAVTLATLGLAAGDWIEIEIPVELNDWAGWDYLDSSIRGPVQIGNTVTVTGGGWTTGNYVGGRNRSLICSSKMWLPTGLTMTNIRLDNTVVLRHLCTTGGTGVAKIGAPIIRKIASPRTAWNLTA